MAAILTGALLVSVQDQASADETRAIVSVVGQSPSQMLYTNNCDAPEGSGRTYIHYGELPPGITLNGTTGMLEGAFTTAGTFIFDGSAGCSWNNGATVQVMQHYITFVVYETAAESTPAPTLTAEALGDRECTVRLTASIPATQDIGSLLLTISAPGEYEPEVFQLVEQPENTTFDLDVKLDADDSSFIDSDLPLLRTSNRYIQADCNQRITFTLSYRHQMSPVASASVVETGRFVNQNPDPVVVVDSWPSDLCWIGLDGWFPQSGDSGTRPTITITGEDSGNILTIYPILSGGGAFELDVPLDDMSQYFVSESGEIAQGSLAPDCGEFLSIEAIVTVDGANLVGDTQTLGMRWCDAGDFDNGDACVPAPAGSYVPGMGMTQATLCPKGTFQNLIGASACTDAPRGYYTDRVGSVEATPCPGGKVTEHTGSTSPLLCYVLKNQAFTTFKPLSKLKYRASTTVPLVTDSGFELARELSGRCATSITTMKVKVGKITRNVQALKITAGTETTTCVLRLTNEGNAFYSPYTKVHTIKVTRTGK
ncbi:MAG: hypothetical protein RL142_97 [Actinomycetota bacterium]